MCRILIVDDDELLRRAIERLVIAIGHTTFTAEGVAAALDVLDATAIDFVLTDFRMGTSDGLALATAVQRRWSWIPVVLMSGDLDDELHGRALHAGVVGCLRKPFPPAALLSAIARATSSSDTHA